MHAHDDAPRRAAGGRGRGAARRRPALEEATARTRAMYKRCGIDPTRTRPSSEALLRRVRKGERCRASTAWSTSSTGVRPRRRSRSASTTSARCSRRSRCGSARRRGLRRHPQGSRQRRGPADAGRRARAVRQPDLGLGADDDDAGDPSVLVVLYVPAAMPRADGEHALALTRERLAEYAGGKEVAAHCR